MVIATCFAIVLPATLSVKNPNSSTSVTTYTNAPLVLLVAYNSNEYASATVTSNSLAQTRVTATIWNIPQIQTRSQYFCEEKSLERRTVFTLYALSGSVFAFTFSHLGGPVGSVVTVEFKRPGNTGNVIKTLEVSPSTEIQSRNYTVESPGYIKITISSGGLYGSVLYNFTIQQVTTAFLNSSNPRCTVNSTNQICQFSTLNSTNYLLAQVTLDETLPQFKLTMNTTLTGKEVITLYHRVGIGGGIFILGIIISIFIFTVYTIVVCRKRQESQTA